MVGAFLRFSPHRVNGDLLLSYLLELSSLRIPWDLSGSNFQDVDFTGANLQGVFFDGPHINGFETKSIDLRGVTLTEADLSYTDLSGINFSGADLRHAKLVESNLEGSNFSGADLRGADLTGCYVYAVSAWNVRLEGSKQKDLVITPDGESEITVDNLEIAQFIYLLLNNQNVRQVINTITSKVVLILGRFREERKAFAELLKQELRTQNYSPVVFDFEEPGSRDFHETVQTLANMARFVVMDLTDLDDVLNEMIKIVPYCRVPIQPLLLLDAQQHQFHQLLDLRYKYSWLLSLYRYQNSSDLLSSFQEKILQPAEEKGRDLRQRELIPFFFFYALEDAKPAAKLKKHLSPLERSGQITIWDAHKLAPGDERVKETDGHLSAAHIILFLISPDFLASDDCVTIQNRAMERHKKGDARVIPVILRACNWQLTSLSELQVLPRDKKPLARQSNRDDVLTELINEIADIIKGL